MVVWDNGGVPVLSRLEKLIILINGVRVERILYNAVHVLYGQT